MLKKKSEEEINAITFQNIQVFLHIFVNSI